MRNRKKQKRKLLFSMIEKMIERMRDTKKKMKVKTTKIKKKTKIKILKINIFQNKEIKKD